MGSSCKKAHSVTAKTYFDEREHFNENLNPGNSFNNLKEQVGANLGVKIGLAYLLLICFLINTSVSLIDCSVVSIKISGLSLSMLTLPT